MDLKSKLVFTVISILGIPILIFIQRFNNRRLKKSLSRSNPKLVEKHHWFFSKKKERVMTYGIAIMVIIFLLLMWLDVIVALIKK